MKNTPTPLWRKPVPSGWITTVPTTSCYRACVCTQGWLYHWLSPTGIWVFNLYFMFCISWNFLTAIPCCSKCISSFLFHFLCSTSWCCCHPWQRSIAIWVFTLRPFKLVLCKNTYLAQETLFPRVLENQTDLYSTKECGNPQDHGLFEIKPQLNLLSFALWCLLQLL